MTLHLLRLRLAQSRPVRRWCALRAERPLAVRHAHNGARSAERRPVAGVGAGRAR